MLKCNDCGRKFDEPATYSECVGEFWGTPAYENWAICPYCKSDEIEEYDEKEDDE